jgi:dynein heavy chain
VSILNFLVTPEGLEDQLLGIVVTEERPDLAEMKNQLVISNAKMKKELKEIEDKILFLLSNSQGNILDDEELIDTLAQSKVTSNEITAKVQEAEKTEKEIDATRELYRPVAIRASLLFFCISDLALIDPMYQYSLTWYIDLFVRGIAASETADDVEVRGKNLNEYFTYSLYNNICRSLFEAHKLLFSFTLAIKIMKHEGKIDEQDWRFLLAGPTSEDKSKPNPAPEWLTDKNWNEITRSVPLQRLSWARPPSSSPPQTRAPSMVAVARSPHNG